jgi:hypothetical protein
MKNSQNIPEEPFNSYTASNNSTVTALVNATSSYIKSSQTKSMSVASSSWSTVQLPDITNISGQVGIGVTSPQFTLDVNGNIGNSTNRPYNSIQIADTSGNMYFNADNYVGVNSSNPQFALDVNGSIGNGYTGNYVDFTGGNGSVGITFISNGRPVLFDSQYVGINQLDYYNVIYTLDVNGSIGNSVNNGYFLSDGFATNINGDHNSYINGAGYFCGIGTTSPYFTCDVGGDINFSGNLYKASRIYVPDNAATSSYVSGPVVATTLMQLPYSSSTHALTPGTAVGSAYFKVSGSLNLLYIYNGTAWHSASLA